MSSARDFAPGSLWSLWDMLTFDAGKVVRAITGLRQIEATATRLADENRPKKESLLKPVDCKTIIKDVDALSDAVTGLTVRITAVALSELRKELAAGQKTKLTNKGLANRIQIVGVTLRRELSLVKTFCISPAKEAFFEIDKAAFGETFETKFASAVYEVDEAGKSYALGRSTACVFHLMRTMEIGVRATARALGIPDPVKGYDRNWGSILQKIKDEIDARNAAKSWKNADKELFENLYVSLDAVRVAWRNTTMHVENKYTEDEAEHIFVSVRGFMKRLSSRMDEEGKPLA